MILTVESKDLMTVWSSSHRKLYKITRDGVRWHIQTPSGKNLATLKSSWREKYIVLAASSPVSQSPFASTPSVIRMESSIISSYNRYKESTFTFGTETSLRWCGLDHFEIIGKYFNHQEEIQILRQRVAFCEGLVENSFVILFDYGKINMEILLSTFLLTLLCQGSPLSKALSYSNTRSSKENSFA